MAPQPQVPKQGIDKQESEQLVIQRSADPLQLLANILYLSGQLAAQWGEEIFLHLRVAALYSRINQKEKAVEYLQGLAALHHVDAFNLGHYGIKYRLDLMRFFLALIGIDEAAAMRIVEQQDKQKKKSTNPLLNALKKSSIGRYLPIAGGSTSMLNSDEEREVRELIRPSHSWLELLYLMPIPADARPPIVYQVNAIREYDEADVIEKGISQLLTLCRNWHERKSDTPIWVHDLDDIGPRIVYLATIIEKPEAVMTYLERCIDALNERPLALMPNIATAIGGLGYLAKDLRRDDLIHRALDFLPRLPEHEQCISALTLVEVLIERQKARPPRI
jgi:hypothetical protein